MFNTVNQTDDFKNWLQSLTDEIAQDAIVARIIRMQSGLLGDKKALGGKVAEIRIDVGQGYRLYYTKHGLEIILLLFGGDKSFQTADIKRGQGYGGETGQGKGDPSQGSKEVTGIGPRRAR